MKKQAFGALACLALLTVPAQAAAPKTFLWRVDAPGASRPDWLFGTMHVPPKPGQLAPVENAIKGATRFAMEVDLKSVEPGAVGRYAALPAPDDLEKLLGPAAWPKLVKITAPKGIPADQLRHLQPWFVALTFLPTPSESGDLIDNRLRAVAEQARVPLTFLESADDQFRALDGVKMSEDVAQLMELIDDPDEPEEEMERLEAAYQAGDQATVERYLFEPAKVKAYPDFYDHVFLRRNATWLPKVEAMMKRDHAFVAVGLGHLLGPKGLIAGLTARGFKVTRAN